MAVGAPELVAAVLGPQWNLAVGLVPWFALAGGCHLASQLSQSLAEARAELNRSVVVQVGYLLVLGALILLALPFSSRGVWVIAAAVAVAELVRYLGYLVLARRVLELPTARIWRAHVPAFFAGLGVALAIAAVRWALTGAPSLAVLAAEITAGALALAVCVRVCPVPAVRTEIQYRLASAGLLGPSRPRRQCVASLVLGPLDRIDAEEPR
jgi:lipopolysaccharide exporter